MQAAVLLISLVAAVLYGVNGQPILRCPAICTKIYQPQCGTDSKTYGNACLLKAATCRNGRIRLAHPGKCGPCSNYKCTTPVHSRCQARKGKRVCTCLFGCPRIYRPVCGSDGKTYNNKCLLEFVSCRRNRVIRITKPGRCGPPKPRRCPLIKCPVFPPKPVCASDGKTYRTACHMKLHACNTNKRLTVRSNGPCSSPRPGSCDPRCTSPKVCKIIRGRPTCVRQPCPRACPRLNRPVCGSDGKTYPNPCMLRRKACTTNTNIRIAHYGQCKGSPPTKCKRLRCRPPQVCKVKFGRERCFPPHATCKRLRCRHPQVCKVKFGRERCFPPHATCKRLRCRLPQVCKVKFGRERCEGPRKG